MKSLGLISAIRNALKGGISANAFVKTVSHTDVCCSLVPKLTAENRLGSEVSKMHKKVQRRKGKKMEGETA